MKIRFQALFTIIAFAISGSAMAAAQHTKTVRPFDSNIAVTQLDISTFATTLKVGEELVLDATLLKRVWIDEARLVAARVGDDEKLRLTAREPGKAAVRLIWTREADKDVELTDDQSHGMRLPKTMFLITIEAPE